MEWLADNFWYIVGVIAIYAVWWFLGWLLERSQKGALKINKKYLYAFIRLAFLAVIVGSISFYYNNQCNYYKDKMLEAMEARDQAELDNFDLRTQVEYLEYELSNKEENYSDLKLKLDQEKYQASEELNAALDEIAWHEDRWDTLVAQKNGMLAQKGTFHYWGSSNYIGDTYARVYHKSDCDYLDVIDDDNKVVIEARLFSHVDGYIKCKWCFK